MKNMKRTILLSALWVCCLMAVAQQPADTTKVKKERTVQIGGDVVDSFTKVGVKAFVTLMKADSTVVDTMTCWFYDKEASYSFQVPISRERYIIRATAEGYEDGFLNYDLKHTARNRWFDLPDLQMRKKGEDIFKTYDLDDVTVIGTRVKIIHKGDTLIYNASAFKVPEGSMLDGLIRQMPGAELKDNGDIYINGRKIDYLTLNGEDFFKGNNKMMLDNLPYYTVENVQVYNKSTEKSEKLGKDIEKKDYVMDVRLKREYNRNYVLNTEIAGGTHQRYLGRIFGLYFDDHTRFSVFGNINNVNENRKPGSDGDWTPNNMPVGLKTTKMAGLNFSKKDKDKRFEENLSASVEWSKQIDEENSAVEQFTDNGSLFQRNQSRLENNIFDFNLENKFELKKPFDLTFETTMRYYRRDNQFMSRTASFNADPSPWGSAIPVLDSLNAIVPNPSLAASALYRNNRRSRGDYDFFLLTGNLNHFQKLPWGDFYYVNVNGHYTRTHDNSYMQNATDFMQTNSTDFRNTYETNPEWKYKYNGTANYTFCFLNDWSVSLSAKYTQEYYNKNQERYRLDLLGNEFGSFSPETLGILPSTREQLMQARDHDNSKRYEGLTRTMREELQFGYNKQDKETYKGVQLSFPLEQAHERMNFHSERLDTMVRRKDVFFLPYMQFIYSTNDWANYWWGNYGVNVSRPSFTQLVGVTDNSSALSVYLVNPNLHNTITHNYNFHHISRVDSINQYIYMRWWGSITHGAIGTRTLYNSQTGTYTYMPDNVNGNWTTGLGVSFSRDLDKKKRWHISTEASFNYNHSVDFDISQTTESQLSKVNTAAVSQEGKIKYTLGSLMTGAGYEVEWTRYTGNRASFETMNVWNFKYGLTFQYKFPLDIQLATDINMYSRRGYSEPSMNTNELVWNASLSRTFLKGKMTACLEGFDLLHQLSNFTRTLNAQAMTEIYKNVLPNYLMLHLSYNFSKAPKGKK